MIVSSKLFVRIPYLAFSLIFIPSQIPFAMALIFFKTPQSSIPLMSSMILTLKCLVVRTSLTFLEFSGFLDAIFVRVGCFIIISDAKLGPDNTTYSLLKYSEIKSPIVFKEGYSIPLAVVTSMVSFEITSFKLFKVGLNAEEGIAKNMISQSIKSFMSVVALILSFNFLLG